MAYFRYKCGPYSSFKQVSDTGAVTMVDSLTTTCKWDQTWSLKTLDECQCVILLCILTCYVQDLFLDTHCNIANLPPEDTALIFEPTGDDQAKFGVHNEFGAYLPELPKTITVHE